MGTASSALVAIALLVAGDARADNCTGVTASGGRFAKCFDLGNRLSVTAGSDGVGGSIKLRHLIRFDDEPDLVWKLEHNITEVTWGAWHQQLDTSLYRGRFLRHARDGHIVLPFGIPKKIFLPFDIGAETTVGNLAYRPYRMPEEQLSIGVVNIAGLVDFARTRSHGRRFAIGPIVRWDVDVDRSMGRIGKVSEHAVSPFTMGMLNVHLESSEGLWTGDLRVEAGSQWHTQGGWKAQAQAEATLERIVIAINDRPIALTAGVAYETMRDEAIARIGARVVLMHRNDKRVNLRPLTEKRTAPQPRPASPPKPVVKPAPPPPPKPPTPIVSKPAPPVVAQPPAPTPTPPPVVAPAPAPTSEPQPTSSPAPTPAPEPEAPASVPEPAREPEPTPAPPVPVPNVWQL